MKERPILFSSAMVTAILEGKKIQTRRVITPQPEHLQRHEWRGKLVYDGEHRLWCWREHTYDNIRDFPDNDERRHLASQCPYGVTGDRLWVRETWQVLRLSIQPMTGVIYNAVPFAEIPKTAPSGEDWELDYRADGEDPDPANAFPWRPGIYMPRWASRITLEITEVRVQRLGEISEEDARSEGMSPSLTHQGLWHNPLPEDERDQDYVATARDAFGLLWQHINGERAPWSSNPWVWALTFRRLP